jgi:uncharacterized protein
MNDDSRLRLWVFALGVAFEGGLALLALLLGWLLGTPPLADFRWSASDAALGAAAAVPMLALFLLIERYPAGPLGRIRRFLDEVVRPLFRKSSPLELAVISLLAGLGEEMLFRGVIQAALQGWLGPLPALLLASALFGLLHPITATYVVLAAVLGLYLGGVWMLTGNLLVVIVTHALYDFVLLVYLVRRP